MNTKAKNKENSIDEMLQTFSQRKIAFEKLAKALNKLSEDKQHNNSKTEIQNPGQNKTKD